MRKAGKRWWTAGVILMLVLAIGVGAVAVYLEPYARVRMDVTLLDVAHMGQPAVLYARTSTPGAAEAYQPVGEVLQPLRPCVYVPYEGLPADLIHAFVAIEDKRFFEHRGVDVCRTANAVLNYVKGGRRSFGGSTITQQLVKNLTERDEYTPERKISEIFSALDLERQADKSQVLTSYLNIINLANGCRGVGAAAAFYFDKSVGELTVAECACLAAITNNPSRYDPISHPDHNRTRRATILGEMRAQGYISDESYNTAIQENVTPIAHRKDQNTAVSSWYADLVASDVIRDLQERLGYTLAQATRAVYGGGLRIDTAMDPALQTIVEDYYADVGHFPVGEDGRPRSAMMIIDPSTGAILAVAGAVGKKTASRVQNYATDTRRPAGSVIKPLSAYAPALAQGRITWSTMLEDQPLQTVEGRPWPRNADGRYHGRVSISTALTHSLNTLPARLIKDAGETETFDFLHDTLHMTGLKGADKNGPHDATLASLALGQQSGGVTVRELTAAYTVFYDGEYRAPVSYRRVTDADGRLLLENHMVGETVLSEANACVMTQMLRRVVTDGTAHSLTMGDRLGIEVAGKTGTTQNNCDRWFVGYTPRLLAGVWMGYDYPAPLNGIDGNPCLGIWDNVMQACEQAYKGTPSKNTFDIHPDVIRLSFCCDSGCLPRIGCRDHAGVEDGWFVRGTEPTRFCPPKEDTP